MLRRDLSGGDLCGCREAGVTRRGKPGCQGAVAGTAGGKEGEECSPEGLHRGGQRQRPMNSVTLDKQACVAKAPTWVSCVSG